MVWSVNSSHSIIAEHYKGKQTYPHSPSLRNQSLRHIHSIGYNNIYYLTLCGKRIAITTTRGFIHERDDDNNSSSKNARNKSKHHYMFGGVSYAE